MNRKIRKKLKRFSILMFLLISQYSLAYNFKSDSLNNISLNGSWKFKTDPNNKGEEEAWFKDEHKKVHWDSIRVPGNWDVKNEYAKYAGKAWLSKDFNIQKDWESKNVRIFFESVYNEA